MTLDEIIKNRRQELGLTLEDIGNAVGVDRATVMRWEKGQIQKMGRDKISALSSVLKLDPIIFIQPKEILFPEEKLLLTAYRNADPGTQASVRKLLDIPEEKKVQFTAG